MEKEHRMEDFIRFIVRIVFYLVFWIIGNIVAACKMGYKDGTR